MSENSFHLDEIESGITPEDLDSPEMREFVRLFGPGPIVYLSKTFALKEGKRVYIKQYDELTRHSRKRGYAVPRGTVE